jgi:hypothetical protein
VAAVLGDTLRRVSVVGGREGMPRSLGSVLGGTVTRFLGGTLCGYDDDMTTLPVAGPLCRGIAVTRDDTLLLTCHHIHDDAGNSEDDDSDSEYATAEGFEPIHCIKLDKGWPIDDHQLLVTFGSVGSGPLQFRNPGGVWVAPDGCVFVADTQNHRVQELSPRLRFRGFIGVGLGRELCYPTGVCADADVVVVSGSRPDGFERKPMPVTDSLLAVFKRSDGSLLRRFGPPGSGDGELEGAHCVCFTHDNRNVAVADGPNKRVCIFTVTGVFVRHIGVGVLDSVGALACSAFDELVVTDKDRTIKCVRVFSSYGDQLDVFYSDDCFGSFKGCTIHDGRLFTVESGWDDAAEVDTCVVIAWT